MTQTENDNVYQEGLLQPNKEMGTSSQNAISLIQSRLNAKEMERISLSPPPPPQIEFLPSVGVSSPHFISISFSPHFIFIALFEREGRTCHFRIEIGLKGPLAVKVPRLSEWVFKCSILPKVGHCIFIDEKQMLLLTIQPEICLLLTRKTLLGRLLPNQSSAFIGGTEGLL
ncbi:hypothetical protein CEXT_319611 [Caerostris extrusa]|uniref:Uncharacterized protein n=1 Tax=Caerostris extrusa TaxID=172846 RepID=A0AAV4WWU7_CAEEX|nr:hypothetical protein CEXT_319611 [Caerostris extrusa]